MESRFCTYKRVGYLRQKVANELGIEFTGVIYASPGVLKHIIKRHGRQLDRRTRDGIEMEIMPDHVHLLMEVDPQFGVHKAVKQIKGRTSRVLRQEFGWLRSRLPSLWTNSYFVSTVGGAPLSVIKQYIENQKNV